MSSVLLLLLLAVFCVVAREHVEVTLALRPKSLEALTQVALEVADPDSPKCGKYLSLEEMRHLVGVSKKNFTALSSWLKKLGAQNTILLPSGDLVVTHLPLEVARKLYRDIHKKESNLPGVSSFRDLIHVVSSKANLVSPHSQGSSKGKHEGKRRSWGPSHSTISGPYGYDPNTQKQFYGVDTNLKGTNPHNVQMVWGPGTFGVSLQDLAQFYQSFSIPASTGSVSFPGFLGTPGGDNWGEGTLDATYITSLAPGVATLVVNSNTSSSTEEGSGFGYAFYDELLTLSQLPSFSLSREKNGKGVASQSLPLVLSLSLGSLSWYSCDLMCTLLVQEGKQWTMQDCQDYMQTQRQVCMYDSAEQTDRMNEELMKLGARGVSIFVATGDGGSHFSFGPFPPDGGIGSALNDISCRYNFPTFPTSSPWVTAVGGIDIVELAFNRGAGAGTGGRRANGGGGRGDGVAVDGGAKAWSGSGGGWSWRFPVQSYQKRVVQEYVQKYSSSSGFPKAWAYNASNRAYPDVAAVANVVPMVLDGQVISVGGTSAATPTFTGIISLINDQRLNAGLPPLGFLNPKLYKISERHPGQAFYDVTNGNTRTSCSEGFPAGVGWDPTTGLGSPLFAGLSRYLVNLTAI
eukprot:TRINITY_DN12484_c0_g1_i5.p1 TRINITY_DN12484_c0_g1~~TRINITY_DN12484_c0_g1_i5.p1  ORF type:complete len:649 (+),score=172.34 TRINITY_DN12484_c0_g1_i5:57-1949(+)